MREQYPSTQSNDNYRAGTPQDGLVELFDKGEDSCHQISNDGKRRRLHLTKYYNSDVGKVPWQEESVTL
ncbi:hypothetical protein ACF0H5_018392 [Mactra antiquata]